ncbi:uncharacterized protein LOC131638335 [Vicia villosa]|uniref:uncharacterized protein LOC131638335 n=1 Tax=Vicia villosa TaxID=3911 RepID=UPI00273BE5B4|nr:uncharacterized protein LOC131638335 [Vicia villosa]
MEAFVEPPSNVLSEFSSGSMDSNASFSHEDDTISWTKTITFGRIARRNVLVLPREVCRFLTAFPRKIDIFDADMGIVYQAELRCALRNTNEEAYIGVGWYEYARQRRLKRGDKLSLRINRVPHILVVWLLNR